MQKGDRKGWTEKHLGLVHQPPEGVAVDDFIPVPLVGGADGVGHAGEYALREASPIWFVHSQQSVRVVEKLEREGRGLNLTFEVKDIYSFA